MRPTDVTENEKKKKKKSIRFFICLTAKPFISVSFSGSIISEDFFASLIMRSGRLLLPYGGWHRNHCFGKQAAGHAGCRYL